MSWTQTKGMSPSLRLTRLKNMKNDEFIALTPGLLRHPARVISRRHRQAAPGADASAFQGRLGAQVALLQSPILPAANPAYPQQREFYNLPVDNTHTRLLWGSGGAGYERAVRDTVPLIPPKPAKNRVTLCKCHSPKWLRDPHGAAPGICVHQCSSVVNPLRLRLRLCRAGSVCGFFAFDSDFGFPAPPGCAFASWRLCVAGHLLD
jgi:hypothetical protein